jgi:hypothetical protein
MGVQNGECGDEAALWCRQRERSIAGRLSRSLMPGCTSETNRAQDAADGARNGPDPQRRRVSCTGRRQQTFFSVLAG